MRLYRILLCLTLSHLLAVPGNSQTTLNEDSLIRLLDQGELTAAEYQIIFIDLAQRSKSLKSRKYYAHQLLKFAKEENDKVLTIQAHQILGTNYRFQGKLDDAFFHLFEAAAISEKDPNLEGWASEIYAEISTCYSQIGDQNRAITYNLKAVNILRKGNVANNQLLLSQLLLNIGYDHYLMKQYDSAIYYYDKVETLQLALNDPLTIAYLAGNKALVDWKKGEIAVAKVSLNHAIDLLNPLGDKFAIADFNNQLAFIYTEDEYWELVIQHASLALNISKSHGYREQNRDAAYLLFNAYKHDSRLEEAITFQSEYHQIKDSITNNEVSQKIAMLEAKHDFQIKQKRKNSIIKRRNTLQYSYSLIIILLLFVVGIAFRFLRIPMNRLESIIFFSFLVVFEFLLVLFDPMIGNITEEAPLPKLLLNSMIALAIVPAHNFSAKSMRLMLLKDINILKWHWAIYLSLLMILLFIGAYLIFRIQA